MSLMLWSSKMMKALQVALDPEGVLEFIGKNKDRPFFAYYPMVLVHSPFRKTPDSKPTDEKTSSISPM